MAGDTNGPTFQQWVGTYTTLTSSKSSRFSPLELKSDGTLLIAGQAVDFTFSGGESSISIGRFTLKGESGSEDVVGAKLNLKYENARAQFTGSITAGQSGPVNFYGEQPTREHKIPNFWSDVKMSTAIHDGHLHVVGAMSVDHSYRGRMVVHRQFPLNRLPVDGPEGKTWSAAPLSDEKHWSKELWQGDYWKNDLTDQVIWDLKNLGVDGGYKWASSPRDEDGGLTNADITSLVSIGGKLYCFYTFSDSAKMSLRARQFTATPKRNDGVWGEEMILFEPGDDTDQDSLLFHTGAVSAVAFNETQILVSACGTGDEATGGDKGLGYGQLMFYLFDISDTNNTSDGKGWAALSKRWVDVNKEVDFYLQDKKWPLENRTGAGLTIDADWFVSAVPSDKPKKSDKPDKLEPVYHLAVNFGVSSADAAANQHTNFTWQCHIPLEVEDAEGGSAGDIALKTNPWRKGRVTAFSNQDGMHSSLKKDASGRLQSLNYFGQKTFSPDYTRTDQPVSAANYWGSANPTDKIDYYGTDDHTKPFNTFYMFSPGNKTVDTPRVNPNGEKTTSQKTTYPILEFICYGINKIQLHDYGSIRVVSDSQDLAQKDKNRPVYLIGGYFDGPVPFPLQNFMGVGNLTGGVADVASFTYGNSQETGKTSSTESTWNVGMEAEGKTTEGIGLGFKASYEYEDTTKSVSEFASEVESFLAINAKVRNAKSPYNEPEPEADTSATTLTAQFHITGFQFANRWGKITSDGLSKDRAQSPKLGRVLARTMNFPDQKMVSFESSLVTKGDLESYTAEAIDAKMGKHYVRDVICKNAYVFGGGQPYLEYTWTHGNMSVDSFESLSKAFTSHEWSHGAQASIGLTGGGGIDIFGMGEEYEFSVMAGGGYKREWSKENLTEAKWTVGAEANEFDIPMPVEDGGDPDGVVAYSFRAYFLPVPTKPSTLPANQWAKDLQDMLPEEPEGDYTFTKDQVDTGFGCWRIFFLVTSIKYREGSKKPTYNSPDDLDDVRSVYAGDP